MPKEDEGVKVCRICGAKHYANGLCKRCYHREYQRRPEVKAKMKETKRKYLAKPEVKARQREYYQRPEVKARQREYYQRQEVKARAVERFYLRPCFPPNVEKGKRILTNLRKMPEEQDKFLECTRPYVTECVYNALKEYLEELRK